MSALALVAECDDVPNSRDALAAWATRARATRAVRSGAWARALRLWARHNRGEAGGEAGARAVRGRPLLGRARRLRARVQELRARGRARRPGDGRARRGLAGRAARLRPRARRDRRAPHRRARLPRSRPPPTAATDTPSTPATCPPSRARNRTCPSTPPTPSRPAGPARETHVTLRPSTAQLMLRCAAPCGSARVTDRERALRVLVDPFAGSGVIPLEAAATADGGAPSAAPFALALGGEIDEFAVASTAQRSDAAPETPVPRAESALWDAARLPLRTACVDALVSDLPFGHRCGSAKENARSSTLGRCVRPRASSRSVASPCSSPLSAGSSTPACGRGRGHRSDGRTARPGHT